MPTIERVGDRIHLKWEGTQPNPAEIRLAKKVVGASYSKRSLAWTYPLDLVICRDLRKVWADSLDIGPRLWGWAREQADIEEQLIPLLSATDCDTLERLEKHAPVIWAAMNDDECLEPGCSMTSKKHKPHHRIKTHRYQKPVVKYCAVARRAQNASQPGLGKTIETLATFVEADVRGMILVAAPKTSLRTVWEPEVRRWLPGVPVFACTGGRDRRADILTQAIKAWEGGGHSMVIVVINPEMLRTRQVEECMDEECGWRAINKKYRRADKEAPHHNGEHKTASWDEYDHPGLFDRKWAGLVVDETHRYLLKVNLRTNKATQWGVGAMLLPLEPNALKLGLSGTPWKGKSKNAWSIGHWLRGDVGLAASFWNWAKRMYDVDQVQVSAKQKVMRMSEAVADEPTFNRWVDGFMIRHTKKEMAPWLPDKTYGGSRLGPSNPKSPVGVWLDFDDAKQEKAYRDMERNASVRLESGTLIGNGVLAELTRLKQFAISHGDMKEVVVKGKKQPHFTPLLPSNKFNWLLQFLEEHGITGDNDEEGEQKVVVAGQFTEVINLFAAEFQRRGIGSYVLTGETKDQQREQMVKEFMREDSRHRLFILNTWAGGVSVTLDAADDLVFIDETYIPDDQEQVEDRIHRTGRIHNVGIWYLRSRNTIDERIAVNNITNDNIQKKLLDGRRGVEFAKKLVGG